MVIQRLKGTRDFYPEEKYTQDFLFRTWETIAKKYGYQNFDGPLLEPAELWKAKSGDELAGQMYSFVDKGGKEVAIRPELTPTLARMMAARKDLKKPLRLYNIGRFWRYEQPQSGRLREFSQLNVDLLGEESMLADAEVIATLVSIARAFGLTGKDCYIRLSNRKLIESLLLRSGVKTASLKEISRLIDKYDKIGEKNFVLSLKDAGLTQAIIDAVLQLFRIRSLDDIPASRLDEKGQEGLTELKQLMTYLSYFGVLPFVELDFSLMRGLDYYTSTVFELYDRNKEFRALAGGGRYENLVAALGGEKLPGVGYGMGDVVVELFLQQKQKLPSFKRDLDVFVIPLGEETLQEAIALCTALRQTSLVEMGMPNKKLAKQLGDIAKAGVPFCVIVGLEEVKNKQIRLKNLLTEQETLIPRADFLKDPAHYLRT